MTGYFELKSLQDDVTSMNAFGMQGVKAIDLPIIFPQFFAIKQDSNGFDRLECKKYHGQALVLTMDNNGTPYTAPSIRLFGGRPRPPKRYEP